MKKAQAGQLSQNVTAILGLLERNQLLWKSRISPLHVYIHPSNRDGYGVNPQDCRSLINDIAAIGWNWALASPAVAFEIPTEIPTEGATREAIASFNHTLYATSQGSLPPVKEAFMRYASVGCSHTNTALRMIHAQCAHDGALSSNGVLNADLLRQHDADFFDAYQSGLQWSVISSSVSEEFPELPSLIQEALNLASQVSRREHELQLCRRILNCYRAAQAARPGKAVQFQDLKNALLRSRSKITASLPYMYTFLLKFGGGEAGDLLQETEQMVRATSSADRLLGQIFWQAISQDMRKGEVCLRFRHALLRAAYCCPEGLITASDAKRMCSAASLAQVVQADGLMQELRSLASQLQCSSEVMPVLWDFEVAIVLAVLDKRHKDMPKGVSLEAIAQETVDRVHKQHGIILTTKFEAHRPVVPDQRPAAGSSRDGPAIATLCHAQSVGFCLEARSSLVRVTHCTFFGVVEA